MNDTLVNLTSSTVLTVPDWARYYEADVFETPTIALDAAHAAKMDADFGEDEEIKTRRFENTLLSLVAIRATRDGFSEDEASAIAAQLAEMRGHYRKDGDPING